MRFACDFKKYFFVFYSTMCILLYENIAIIYFWDIWFVLWKLEWCDPGVWKYNSITCWSVWGNLSETMMVDQIFHSSWQVIKSVKAVDGW